jgi:hypothetical protein
VDTNIKEAPMTRLAMIAALTATTLFAGAASNVDAAPKSAASGLTIPVTGSGSGGTFTGTFDLQQFAARNGEVAAVGTLTGTVTNALGQATSIVRNVTLPVDVGQTTCEILHLDLGPLSLDLLGLQVDLNRIVLDITAQSGAGNLLGNLLCGVAGLLDQPNGLANLLNQILSRL